MVCEKGVKALCVDARRDLKPRAGRPAAHVQRWLAWQLALLFCTETRREPGQTRGGPFHRLTDHLAMAGVIPGLSYPLVCEAVQLLRSGEAPESIGQAVIRTCTTP